MTTQKRVLLVDGMNTFIRSWVIVPVRNSNGEHYGGVYGFLRSVKAAVDKFKPTEVVICWDGAKGGLRRKELMPAYKANRTREWKRGSNRAFDFLSEYDQQENFTMQLKRISEYLETLPVKAIRIPFIEADDVIAIYIQRLEEDTEVVIYSSDADFKQLVTEKVTCYNPIAKLLTTPEAFYDKHSMGPHNYIIMKSIMGDKSDNVAGIKGIGEKTLLKMFPELSNDDLFALDEVLVKANSVGFSKKKDKEFTPGVINKFKVLAENADLLRLNHRIMQLQDPEISNEAKRFIYSTVGEHPGRFNDLKLMMMFIEDKLEKTVKTFDPWVDTFAGLQR